MSSGRSSKCRRRSVAQPVAGSRRRRGRTCRRLYSTKETSHSRPRASCNARNSGSAGSGSRGSPWIASQKGSAREGGGRLSTGSPPWPRLQRRPAAVLHRRRGRGRTVLNVVADVRDEGDVGAEGLGCRPPCVDDMDVVDAVLLHALGQDRAHASLGGLDGDDLAGVESEGEGCSVRPRRRCRARCPRRARRGCGERRAWRRRPRGGGRRGTSEAMGA